MKRNVVISLSELPARPEPLSPEDLSNVFGGCNGPMGMCWEFNPNYCCSKKCFAAVFVPVCA